MKQAPKKILIVDDEPMILTLLEARLSPRYQVFTALDGEEAFHSAKMNKPDLILSDLLMPRLDGAELTQRLARHTETSRIPVIILSALEDTASIRRAQEAGAVDYFQKPLHLGELPDLIGRYV